jgi:hypothetical protein
MQKPSEKEIAARAYELWRRRQIRDKEEALWHRAQQELIKEHKSKPNPHP